MKKRVSLPPTTVRHKPKRYRRQYDPDGYSKICLHCEAKIMLQERGPSTLHELADILKTECGQLEVITDQLLKDREIVMDMATQTFALSTHERPLS